MLVAFGAGLSLNLGDVVASIGNQEERFHCLVNTNARDVLATALARARDDRAWNIDGMEGD